jgi:hypothetical protein
MAFEWLMGSRTDIREMHGQILVSIHPRNLDRKTVQHIGDELARQGFELAWRLEDNRTLVREEAPRAVADLTDADAERLVLYANHRQGNVGSAGSIKIDFRPTGQGGFSGDWVYPEKREVVESGVRRVAQLLEDSGQKRFLWPAIAPRVPFVLWTVLALVTLASIVSTPMSVWDISFRLLVNTGLFFVAQQAYRHLRWNTGPQRMGHVIKWKDDEDRKRQRAVKFASFSGLLVAVLAGLVVLLVDRLTTGS